MEMKVRFECRAVARVDSAIHLFHHLRQPMMIPQHHHMGSWFREGWRENIHHQLPDQSSKQAFIEWYWRHRMGRRYYQSSASHHNSLCKVMKFISSAEQLSDKHNLTTFCFCCIGPHSHSNRSSLLDQILLVPNLTFSIFKSSEI